MVAAFHGGEASQPAHRWRPRWWVYALAPVLLVAVVILQRPAVMDPGRVADLRSGKLVLPPELSPEIAVAKIVIAYHGKTLLGTDFSPQLMAQLDPPPPMPGMPKTSVDAQDRWRAAVLLGKLGEGTAMKERLTSLRAQIVPDSPLHGDTETAIALVEGRSVDPTAVDEMVARHGWFGRLLLDDGSSGGAMAQAKEDGEALVRVFVVAVGVMVILFLAGILAIITFAAMLLTGGLKPWPTPWLGSPDSRPLWLETVVMFLGGFLALKLVIMLAAVGVQKNVVSGVSIDHLVWLSLLGQWLLVAVLFWPRLRGMSREQHRAELGWHRGRGLLREIGAGLLSYAAMVPLYFVLAFIVAIGMFVYYSTTGKEQPPIENRVIEMAAGGVAEVVMVFMLATIWAPLVEETIFRGALYRLVRARGGVVLATLASAAVFAALHGYFVPQLILVGSLGFCFALMREWRGSLISSMTAHAVHNGLVFSFMASIAPLMRG